MGETLGNGKSIMGILNSSEVTGTASDKQWRTRYYGEVARSEFGNRLEEGDDRRSAIDGERVKAEEKLGGKKQDRVWILNRRLMCSCGRQR